MASPISCQVNKGYPLGDSNAYRNFYPKKKIEEHVEIRWVTLLVIQRVTDTENILAPFLVKGGHETPLSLVLNIKKDQKKKRL